MPTNPVIVVGSGLAGLSAAYEALMTGTGTVHLLDRAPKPGGNSIKASSGINGAGTRFQKAVGIASDDVFYDDTVRSAGVRFTEWQAQEQERQTVDRQKLVKTLVDGSEAAVTWLADEFGVDLSVVAALGGHSIARTHRGGGKTPPGADIVTRLLAKLKEFDARFKLDNLAEVVSLTTENGSVNGVRYVHDGQTRSLQGAVVFAAGGFAGDTYGLLQKHRPDLAGIPSTNEQRPGAHDILESVGAGLVDMDSVQVHPTGFVDPKDAGARYKFLAAEALRGEGGILLNSHTGGRFVNEMGTREQVSRAIMALPPTHDQSDIRHWDVTVLLDPGACDVLAGHLGFYIFKGFLEKKRVRELPPAVIQAIDNYATVVAAGQDVVFGRTNFGRWRLPAGEDNRDEIVCVGTVTPVVHFTMGGAAFDTEARVLTPEGEPVGGLWAAGEITGGVHGDNRLGGSSLLECVVFGRIAGREAAKAAAGQ